MKENRQFKKYKKLNKLYPEIKRKRKRTNY